MADGEYNELRTKIVVKSDTSGLDKVKEGIKDTQSAATGLNKTMDGTAESIERVSKVVSEDLAGSATRAEKILDKVNDVLGRSSASLLKDIAESQQSKLENMVGSGTFDKGAIAKQALATRKAWDTYFSERGLAGETVKNPVSNVMTPEQAKAIAEQTSQLDLLKQKADAAAERYTELFNKGASATALANALKTLKTAQEEYNNALQKAYSSQSKQLVNVVTPEQANEFANSVSKITLLTSELQQANEKLAQSIQGKLLGDNSLQNEQRITSGIAKVQSIQSKLEKAMQNTASFQYAEGLKQIGHEAEASTPALEKFAQAAEEANASKAPATAEQPSVDPSKVQTALDTLFSDTANAATQAKSAVGGFMDSLGQRAMGNMDRFVGGLKNIISSFKRIAFYRFIRSVIRSITEGFREGVNNLYQWSKMLGGEFAQSMDRIATSTLYMKNSLGAMVAPLINALAPAVDYLIDKFVALLNVINQVLALFTGAATWTKAKKYPTQYADAVSSGAGKAADALHKLGLAQIDELTILDKNHGDNGSGGGGGSGLDYGSMFETEKLGGGIWDKIKEAIDKGDWRGAGKILAERLNEIVDSLDTHKWGQELGKKLDNGIQLAYGFMKFTNFKNIGKKIAEFINGSMEMIDWETAGRLAVRNVTALLDTIIGILGGLDWGLVATSIKDYLVGKMNEIGDWFDSVEWDKVGTNLYNNVKKFIENINFDELARTFFYNLGKAFGHIAVAVGAFFNGAFEDVKKYFADKTEEAGGDSFKGFLKGIGDGVKSIGQWIKTNVIDPFVKGWKEALGIQSPSTVMAAIGKDTIDGFFKGITDVINGVRQWVQTKVIDPVVNAFKGALGIQSPSTVMASVGKDTIDGFLKGIRDGINNIGNWIKTNIINPVVNGFKNALGIHSPSTVMNDIGKDTIAGFRNGLVNAWTSITSWVKQKITDLKNAFKFEWKLPDIKLPHIPTPHFHIGTGIMGIQYPVFDGWWAQGGFPTEGSLFIAREPGNPEMVGSIGGHTAVANNDQIVAAVSQGVFEAVREAMGNGNQSVNVFLDGKQISGTVVQNINSETRRTGSSPLLSY